MKNKNNVRSVFLKAGFMILIFLVGILAGIQMGTYAVIDHVAYGLAGSTFIVNINETRMVQAAMQEFNYTILPQIRKEQSPYDINWDAVCPGKNTSKTVVECIKEIENKV
jgi:hypothetical protein